MRKLFIYLHGQCLRHIFKWKGQNSRWPCCVKRGGEGHADVIAGVRADYLLKNLTTLVPMTASLESPIFHHVIYPFHLWNVKTCNCILPIEIS